MPLNWFTHTMGSSDDMALHESEFTEAKPDIKKDTPTEPELDLSKSMVDLVKNEVNKNVVCDEMVENILATMNEKSVGFVTIKLLGIQWIKYYESDRHVFWTPVNNNCFPATTIGLEGYRTIIEWMSSRLEWEIAHVKIAIPSKFQHDKICSFFKRNKIPLRDFWRLPRWFESILKWFGHKITGDDSGVKEFRPIIIENKLGGLEHDSK